MILRDSLTPEGLRELNDYARDFHDAELTSSQVKRDRAFVPLFAAREIFDVARGDTFPLPSTVAMAYSAVMSAPCEWSK